MMAVEITEEFVWQNIPRRPRTVIRGTFGSVLAVAGSAFYRGAALLAAEGALRTGAGIVTPCQCGTGGERRRSSPAGVLPVPLQGRGRGRYFPGKHAAAPAAESNRSAAWPRPWRHRPECGPRRRDTGPCAAAFARFCGQCRAGRRRPERRSPAAGRRGSLPTPGGGS